MQRHRDHTEALIVDRGRGPELRGTRVTIYRIMDYLRDGCSAPKIATELELTNKQVEAALAYIAVHRDEVDVEYAKIITRVNQPNAPAIESKVHTADELRERIVERRAGKGGHDRPVRQ